MKEEERSKARTSALLLKRGLGFVMALIALAVFAPLFVILGLLVKLTSREPVLFSQTRCGVGGRKFTLYKFRSMRADALRCTPIGGFMRKYSLDELPQLINVIKGDLSWPFWG
jgi:lipopolysaccharide/colanic/teichoic acid biosynthesis glycosyltransferase